MDRETLLTTTAIPGDGRPSLMPAEHCRIAGIKSANERQLRHKIPGLATARQKYPNGRKTERYFWSESFRCFTAYRAARHGMTWPVALDLAKRSLDGLCHYALQGVSDPGSYYFGIRPRGDDDTHPLVYEMPHTAVGDLQLIANLRAAGVLTIVVPVRQLLAEYCARATAELGVEVTPRTVLACHIAGSPDRREEEA